MSGYRQSLRIAAMAAWLAAVPANGRAAEPVSPPRTPIVETCVNKKGKIKSTRIVHSSGFKDVDAAALKIAKNSKYTAADDTSKKGVSCVKFKVKFVIRDDGTPVPAG